MTGYPHYPPRRAAQVGALVLLTAVGLLVAGITTRHQRSAWWRLELPVDPAALAAPTKTQSRLLGWRAWSYVTRSAPRQVRAFYAEVLGRNGWTATAETEDRTRYRRGELALEMRCQPADEGTAVYLVLTPDSKRR